MPLQMDIEDCDARLSETFCRPSTACRCKAETERHEGCSAQRDGWSQEGLAASLWPLLLGCGPALADAEAKYNPKLGSDSVKSIAGVFYAGLLAVFAYRLLTRRAKKFREEVRCVPSAMPAKGFTPVPAANPE